MLRCRVRWLGPSLSSFPACGDASGLVFTGRERVLFLPRVRGCFTRWPLPWPSAVVPSPRAGMLRSTCVWWTAPRRSFPACGDASATTVPAMTMASFLPRVRGCFCLQRRGCSCAHVPSPRAGMLLSTLSKESILARSFPACGDASGEWRCSEIVLWFLPRVRGCFQVRAGEP